MSKNITEQSVFGAYSQTENQVTSALLKILETDCGGGSLLDEILQRIDEGNGLPEKTLKIETQSHIDDTDINSIPDGLISCNYAFNIYIESKLSDVINLTQLENHKKLIVEDRDERNKLIYITTHDKRPEILPQEIIWTNWTTLMNILNDYQQDVPNPVLSYLIEQFELLITSLGLYDDHENRVIIVGGRWGEPIALEYNFYACQGGRSFKKAKYLAFYYAQRIQYLFEIEKKLENVDIRELKEYVPEEYFAKKEPLYKPEKRTFFKLKKIEEFSPAIQNDSFGKTGRRIAFTQGQTYTTLERIRKAKVTSELRF